MANHKNERKVESAPQGSELLRLKYGHIENIIVLAIVALITLGGFACIICGQSCGQTIVIAVLSFVGGWVGAKRINRSGRT